jgi:hypothetical protein
MTTRCWRIRPDAALDCAVEQLARRESRSTSNMLFVLLREAIAARRQMQPHHTDERLVSMIAAKSDVSAA